MWTELVRRMRSCQYFFQSSGRVYFFRMMRVIFPTPAAFQL